MIRLIVEPDVSISIRDSIVECVLLCRKLQVGTTTTINGIVVECNWMFKGRNADEVDRIYEQYKEELKITLDNNK